MWAQTWNNLYDRVMPFKDKQGIDVTPALVRQVSVLMEMLAYM